MRSGPRVRILRRVEMDGAVGCGHGAAGHDRFWLAILLVTAGDRLLAGGAAVSGSSEPLAFTDHAASVSFTPTALDAAVVPGRAQVGAHVGANQAPGRSLLPLVAALVALAGLPSAPGRAGSAPAAGRPPLLPRRHAIALRAPPSPRFV